MCLQHNETCVRCPIMYISHDVNQELCLFSLNCCRVDCSTSIFHLFVCCVFFVCANETINAKAAN